MSIQAIKAVEIGLGFGAARVRGSEVHDPIGYGDAGFTRPSNRAGGAIDMSFLVPFAGRPLPNQAACDYLLCKGANAAIHQAAYLIPPACRGVFNVYADMSNTNYGALMPITGPLVVRLGQVAKSIGMVTP